VNVVREHLEARGLSEDSCVKGVEVIDKDDIADFVQDADATVTF